jgi:hypothetical protein
VRLSGIPDSGFRHPRPNFLRSVHLEFASPLIPALKLHIISIVASAVMTLVKIFVSVHVAMHKKAKKYAQTDKSSFKP